MSDRVDAIDAFFRYVYTQFILALPVTIDGADESKWSPAASRSDQPTNADGTVIAVAALPSEVWLAAAKWARETGTLQVWQRKIAYSLGKLGRGSQPSPKQAIQGRKLMLEAIRLGFGHEKLTKDLIEGLGAAEPSIGG